MQHLQDNFGRKFPYIRMSITEVCNFKCGYCLPNGYMADKSDNRKFLHIDEIRRLAKGFSEMGVQKIRLTGGEPTISPEVLKLFEICIDEGYAKNLQLNITTNGTKFNKKFLEKIEHFKDVHLNISCDGYDKVYDYIRYPFNWNKFAERINDIAQGKVSFSISTLPQMYNIENLDKLQRFFDPYFEGHNSGSIFVNTFLRPENTYNSLNFVPLHILQYANNKIKRNNNSHVLKLHLERLIKKDYQPTDDDNIEIVKSITSIDTVRNQNYKDYLEPMTVEWLEGLFKKYA